MKWATHGGIISELELESLAAIFRHVTDRAEQLDLDVILSMRPFHFNSCTRNFVAIAERVGSPRLKCQWGAADCVVSVSTATIGLGCDCSLTVDRVAANRTSATGGRALSACGRTSTAFT